jgi:hypothetical protein
MSPRQRLALGRVSSRKEQKEALRRERLAREQAAAVAKARRRRFQIGGGVIVLAAVIVLAVVLIAGGSSNSGASSGSNSNSSGSGTQAGLETGTAPWPPEYSFLAQRLGAFNFPSQTDFGYHVHAELFIYVNGKRITVPANFGIDPQGRFIAPVHTHDTTGIIHMESAKPYPFTLGETFDIWGVKFSDSQLGAYRAGNGNVLQLWVNGKQVADPVDYKMKPHDVMIVGYGKPGSFPTSKQFSFPSGL